jgi:hypothetical protein
VLERVLGSSTHPAALSQEHAQPARADVHPRLLLQIRRESLRRPHVEDQAERAGTALQRCLHGLQIRLICSHRSTGPRGVTQRRHPTRGKARQPVLHAGLRAPAPAGDALHLVAQRRGFDHLQPLAHPPCQIRAAQLPLHVLTLLPGHRDAHGSAPLTPTDFPSDLQVRGAYASNIQFTSGYLGGRLVARHTKRTGSSAAERAQNH